MNRLKLFIPLVIFVVLAVVFAFALKMDRKELPSALIGKSVPPFALSTVKDGARTVTEVDVKGQRFALLNVWATWCQPCRQEHPYLMELAKRGVVIYGINAKDDRELAQKWLNQHGDPYRFSAFDSEGRLGLDLGVYGYPETFLIDKDGKILLRKISVMSEQMWQQDFLPIINALPQ